MLWHLQAFSALRDSDSSIVNSIGEGMENGDEVLIQNQQIHASFTIIK